MNSPFGVELLGAFREYWRSWLAFVGACLVLFCVNLWLEYENFLDLGIGESTRSAEFYERAAQNFHLKTFKEQKTNTSIQQQKFFETKQAVRNRQIYNQSILGDSATGAIWLSGQVVAQYERVRGASSLRGVSEASNEAISIQESPSAVIASEARSAKRGNPLADSLLVRPAPSLRGAVESAPPSSLRAVGEANGVAIHLPNPSFIRHCETPTQLGSWQSIMSNPFYALPLLNPIDCHASPTALAPLAMTKGDSSLQGVSIESDEAISIQESPSAVIASLAQQGVAIYNTESVPYPSLRGAVESAPPSSLRAVGEANGVAIHLPNPSFIRHCEPLRSSGVAIHLPNPSFVRHCETPTQLGSWQSIMSNPFYALLLLNPIDCHASPTALATLAMTKNDIKTYTILKIKTPNGAQFFTTTTEQIADLTHRHIRIFGLLGGKNSGENSENSENSDKNDYDCNFFNYLKSCFIHALNIELLPNRDYKERFRDFINAQHEHKQISQLYRALFIADSINPATREVSNIFGVAHIIAISGFHLGILTLFLTAILTPLYGLIHARFPYRNRLIDIGGMVIVAMFGYLILLDFTPSFLRAFVAAAFGFFLLVSGLNLLSFRLLFAVALISLALFPRLIFSVGFFLSVFGIFYIYLFLKHGFGVESFSLKALKSPKKAAILGIKMLIFNASIFFNMLVLAHFFFPIFSPWNLLSIPSSIAFVVFFPAVLVLHAINLGGIFDGFFTSILSTDFAYVNIWTPAWFFGAFLALSFLAILSKRAYYALNIAALGFYAVAILRFFV